MNERRFIANLPLKWPSRNFPNRIAAIFGQRRITHREFGETANRLSHALLDLGLTTGDRVSVLLRNSIEALIVRHAVNQAGLAYVRHNPAESLEERNYILQHCEASAMILHSSFVDEWKRSEFGRHTTRHEIAVPSTEISGVLRYEDLLSASSPADPSVLVRADDIASISYTSGTTGRPKGAVHTFGSVLNRIRNDFMNQDILIDENDVLLSVAPLTHAAGIYAQVYAIRGASNVILEKFSVEAVLNAIQEERVTAFLMVPTMIVRLVLHPAIGDYDLSSVRRIYYGTAPMPVEALRKAIDIFGHGVFRQQYGLTEHPQPVTFLRSSEHAPGGGEKQLQRLGSVGRVAAGVEVRIVDQSGNELPPNRVGEIQVRSDAGMKEYWKDPEETAKTIVDGWIAPGDVGRIDEDGYLYLVDRTKDMIISGGYNIYPREVERVIESHPAVLEVCVFGVPDDEWGESVKAVVSLKSGADIDTKEIIDFCRPRLSAYKKPRWVEFTPELPKNENGKILRRALRDPYWKDREKNI